MLGIREGHGLTGCSVSEVSRSGIRGIVCLTRVQFHICSFMYCLVGLVLASARYIAKTGMLQGDSDVEYQGAQCKS